MYSLLILLFFNGLIVSVHGFKARPGLRIVAYASQPTPRRVGLVA
jgi:hypothetical protein